GLEVADAARLLGRLDDSGGDQAFQRAARFPDRDELGHQPPPVGDVHRVALLREVDVDARVLAQFPDPDAVPARDPAGGLGAARAAAGWPGPGRVPAAGAARPGAHWLPSAHGPLIPLAFRSVTHRVTVAQEMLPRRVVRSREPGQPRGHASHAGTPATRARQPRG